MNGVFITFEGPDASGKTTQIRLLEERLREQGLQPLLTREPGGTPIGERIREILLDRACKEMTAMTEMLLYAAARAQHVEEVIRPALEAGRIVISDRFTDSSIAYQGSGRGLGNLVGEINEIATGGLLPDLTFLLVTMPSSMRDRIPSGHEDRLEAEQDSFHEKVLEGFLEIRRRHPDRIVLIDGSRSIGTIAGEVWEKTVRMIGNRYEI